jgi:diguanylate cyclase (GGDEF)-like protein
MGRVIVQGQIKKRHGILIIDDDQQIRELLKKLLSEEYDCVTANSAEAALVVLHTKSFALAISDINMDGISGLELVPLVHREAPDTVVVMVSGQQTIETAIKAMRAGAFDYIIKPFDRRQLEAAVRRALEYHELLSGKRLYESNLEDLIKQRTSEVEHMAYYDALTDLPNRILFAERLERALSAAQRNQQMIGTVFLALDRFKKINDTLGPAVGDCLLKAAAGRLKECAGERDTIARFDGDEFVILLPTIKGTDDLIGIVRAINKVLSAPFLFAGHEVYVTASIGSSMSPFDGADSDTLLKNAGAALYRAKKLGGNNYQFYIPDMNEKAVKRLALESSLRRALENEEFVLHYQPVVNLASRRVVGAEALVRWRHPDLGLLQPADFIPLAEDTGLIVPIGAWVLRTACIQARQWQLEGFPDLRIAVNVSARQFQDKDLTEYVLQTLRETELESGTLELELTESSLMQNAELAAKTLQGLRLINAQISIDDFGTGYSSLGYLKQFPIDILKVDRSFVAGATTDRDDAAMVTAIITMAHNLRLKVIAEGIETEEHLEFLRLLGCDAGQGYFLGKPMSAIIFRAFIGTPWVAQTTERAKMSA